jgi:SAM-dependent methyltransferase
MGQDAGQDVTQPEQPGRVPDVIYLPTPGDVVDEMLALADVRRADVVYDLGCGDGRIVVAAAQRGCRAVGVDIDPIRVKQSRDNIAKNRLEGLVRIERQDLFQTDLRPATVVTLYLSPQYNERLIPQLETLKPGSRIVSHQFEIRGVKPDKVAQFPSKEDGHRHALYLWTTPLHVRK